jgi:hypothetical protein
MISGKPSTYIAHSVGVSGSQAEVLSLAKSAFAFQQQDGDYRFYIGVLNEDRQARGLPLIEF